MSKKVLAVILSLILTFSVVAVPAGAADISFDDINISDINLENFNAENFFNLWCLWYFRGSQSVCFWGFGNFGNYVIEVKALEGMLDTDVEIEVVLIEDGKIYVKPV